VAAFTMPTSASSESSFIRGGHNSNSHLSMNINDNNDSPKTFDPLNIANEFYMDWMHEDRQSNDRQLAAAKSVPFGLSAAAALLLSSAALVAPTAADAALKPISFNTGDYNPANFRPVCPASDGVYRFAQSTTQNLVGPDNFVEYGPLIAGGLLRIRLELCVVESFFNEAVGPFIEREGLKWILPLHETVETFLAGTIFALASTFILVGSTKIVSVLVTYADLFLGLPFRWFGGFAFDRARGKPVTLDIGIGPFKTRVVGPGDAKEPKRDDTISEMLDFNGIETKNLPIVVVTGAFKVVGETSKVARDVFEAVDLFVGRYLTLVASGYIGIKFIHFKVFPDFPPF
jgi:hypothetical protein